MLTEFRCMYSCSLKNDLKFEVNALLCVYTNIYMLWICWVVSFSRITLTRCSSTQKLYYLWFAQIWYLEDFFMAHLNISSHFRWTVEYGFFVFWKKTFENYINFKLPNSALFLKWLIFVWYICLGYGLVEYGFFLCFPEKTFENYINFKLPNSTFFLKWLAFVWYICLGYGLFCCNV